MCLMEKLSNDNVSRRGFLKSIIAGSTVMAATVVGCDSPKKGKHAIQEVPKGEMTYRLNNKGEKISILGYGCMRLPTVSKDGTKDGEKVI